MYVVVETDSLVYMILSCLIQLSNNVLQVCEMHTFPCELKGVSALNYIKARLKVGGL